MREGSEEKGGREVREKGGRRKDVYSPILVMTVVGTLCGGSGERGLHIMKKVDAATQHVHFSACTHVSRTTHRNV